MTFKLAVEIMFAGGVLYLLLSAWTTVIVIAVLKTFAQGWFKERELYVKRISSLSDIEKEFEHTNVN